MVHACSSSKHSVSHYAPDSRFKTELLLLEASFDLLNKSVTATASYSFSSKFGGTELISLNAISFLNVSVNGSDRYSYDGKVINLLFTTPWSTKSISIKYTVVNPVAGLYFSVPDESYPDRILHCISDHEPERCRYWIPCIDTPSGKSKLQFKLTADSKHLAIANGRQTDLLVHENTSTTIWNLDEAECPSYLICVAVGDFIKFDDKDVDGMPISYLAPRNESLESLQLTFGKTPAMVDWLQKKLNVKFPWTKYFQICSPVISGAMENISLVTWNDLYLCDERLSSEKQLLVDQVIIHEMAHTYFGDLLGK